MRRSLSLGLLLVALSALPAAAGSRGGSHVFFGFHQGHFAKHFATFRTRSRFFAPSGWGWGSGWGDWADWDGGYAGGGAGTVIVLAGGPPAAYAPPPPAAAPAQATVETEAGVTVVRGPGTHH